MPIPDLVPGMKPLEGDLQVKDLEEQAKSPRSNAEDPFERLSGLKNH